MVKEGKYTVSLVRADTHEPFKEHIGPDYKVYAEVEPAVDYFIKIGVGDREGKDLCAYGFVDGTCLNYCKLFLKEGLRREHTLGIWASRTNDLEGQTMKALRFAKTGRSQSDSVEPTFGSVKVEFSEITFTEEMDEQGHYVSSWVGGTTSVDAAMSETTDKAVCSREGRGELARKNRIENRKIKHGNTLATIEVHYCTAVGLILAGVLPKPPEWERRNEKAQMALSSSMKKCLAVEPFSILVIPQNAQIGQKEVRADFYDLVEADMSDDEEENAILNPGNSSERSNRAERSPR